MQVSISGVPRGGGLISVFGKQCEQIARSIRKLRRWKTNVFDDEICSLRTHLTDDAEEAVADVPSKLNRFGITSELQRPQHFHMVQRLRDLLLNRLEFLIAIEAEFHQQGRVLRV